MNDIPESSCVVVIYGYPFSEQVQIWGPIRLIYETFLWYFVSSLQLFPVSRQYWVFDNAVHDSIVLDIWY